MARYLGAASTVWCVPRTTEYRPLYSRRRCDNGLHRGSSPTSLNIVWPVCVEYEYAEMIPIEEIAGLEVVHKRLVVDGKYTVLRT